MQGVGGSSPLSPIRLVKRLLRCAEAAFFFMELEIEICGCFSRASGAILMALVKPFAFLSIRIVYVEKGNVNGAVEKMCGDMLKKLAFFLRKYYNRTRSIWMISSVG